MKSYINQTKQNVIKSICNQYPSLTYNNVNKLLRKKDVKINGQRIKDNIQIQVGDEVEVYFDFDKVSIDYQIVYQDENILIVNKPQGIEVVGGDNNLTQILSKDLSYDVYPCHRLDLNTKGLVVFAKSKYVQEQMFLVFKNKFITKEYLALVLGNFKQKTGVEKGYLFKDEKKSQVFIYKTQKPNTKFIQTQYEVLKDYGDICLVKIIIPTGRTHQIRAHMSFLGHPIIGDQKYGDVELNKKYGKKRQCLCACKLKFNLPQDHKFSYLNNLDIEIEPNF